MKRKHVTLSIRWDEYIEREPQGYRYSRGDALQIKPGTQQRYSGSLSL
jgi:hypothetical protein